MNQLSTIRKAGHCKLFVALTKRAAVSNDRFTDFRTRGRGGFITKFQTFGKSPGFSENMALSEASELMWFFQQNKYVCSTMWKG